LGRARDLIGNKLKSMSVTSQRNFERAVKVFKQAKKGLKAAGRVAKTGRFYDWLRH